VTLSTRLWIAWKVLRGRLKDYHADANSFGVMLDFTGPERSAFSRRLAREAELSAAEKRRRGNPLV
jgi:hypothetical protein